MKKGKKWVVTFFVAAGFLLLLNGGYDLFVILRNLK